ncbi:hypothetical protein LIER_14157 [Lithospermum erythrorhizon]|uniref:Uncharacterized protein n=1 Tax=Lithospermum erythrorhizon TaxID=34254 RepID=A0AAV3Q2Q1_LITER
MADSEDYCDELKILETNVKEFRDLLQSEKHSVETCVIFRSESTSTEKLIIHRRSKRLIPIIAWAEKENIDVVVPCGNSAAKESRLTEEARLVINDFIRKCMDVYKKGKVIQDLQPQFIWVKCVEEHDVNDYHDDDSDDGVDLNGGVVICDPVLLDLTNENFRFYLNDIYKILQQFSGKCSTIPKDFRHLLDSFEDIKNQGCQYFHPALLSYHPSILVRRTLSNFANEVFMKVRHNSGLINKLNRQLDIVFRNNRRYRPPFKMNPGEWPQLTRPINAITKTLGKTPASPNLKTFLDYNICFLFVIVSLTIKAIRFFWYILTPVAELLGICVKINLKLPHPFQEMQIKLLPIYWIDLQQKYKLPQAVVLPWAMVESSHHLSFET